jgi:competence ComEA-like helix-hairpin-helix protein
MMLWLTAILIVFVVARNSAERAHEADISSRHPRFQVGARTQWTPAGARSSARSASPAAARDRAVGRANGQSVRASKPVVASLVSLNSAGVEELVRLPGVGRRAAERIARHRGRIGGFDSLEDLENIEGFDRSRVRRLSERATL